MTQMPPLTEEKTADRVHPFEGAGLGKAPFRFIGMSENMWSPCPGEPAKPGGCCRYCGNGIRYEFHVLGADGRKFAVGSECIRKVEAKGSRLLTEAERALKEDKRQKKHTALMARVAAARSRLQANPTLLTEAVHPFIEGKTRRDYIAFLLVRGGESGMTRACQEIEARQ